MTRTTLPRTRTALGRTALLGGLSAAAVIGGLTLGPATGAFAADAPANVVGTAVTVTHDTALQPNGWFCGPAAVRNALAAHSIAPSFDEIATKMGTTTSGTNSVNEIAAGLNSYLPGKYTATKISGQPTGAQVEKMRTDIMDSLNQGDAVVVNIAGTATDTAGENHSYTGGHYIAVTGYNDGGYRAIITDSADTQGSNEYQLSINDLANWTATRGYTS